MACLRSNTARVAAIVAALLAGSLVHDLWQAEVALSVPWVPDEGAEQFARRPLSPLRPPFGEQPVQGIAGEEESDPWWITDYQLPLRTLGRDIVDARLRRFKLAAVNWYGASDQQFVPGGLDVQHRDSIARTIRSLGFNSVRLPYSDEMVVRNPVIPASRLAANPDLVPGDSESLESLDSDGPRALDVFAAVVQALTDAGLAVIINNHITTATWCCGANPCDAGWANAGNASGSGGLGSLGYGLGGMGTILELASPLCRLRQTEEQWIAHWETVMAPFVDNPRVIGVDLRNEVRGLWGTMPWERWAAAAERCGNRLLRMRDWLVVVGGTESGNDLRGVARRPVRLDEPHRVVYSAHVYGWSGWGSREGRYVQRPYASFAAAMRRHWAYLLEDNLGPVWVGEFGAPHAPSVGDAHYWENLVRFMGALDVDFGYWALNPRKPGAAAGEEEGEEGEEEEETYGLVADDWQTPVLDYRMRDMLELMRLPRMDDVGVTRR